MDNRTQHNDLVGVDKKRLLSKKCLFAIFAFVIVVFVIVLLLFVDDSPYKEPIDEVVNAVNNRSDYNVICSTGYSKDFSSIMKSFAKFDEFWYYIFKSTYTGNGYFKSDAFDNLDETYGSWTIDFEYVDERKLDADEVKKVQKKYDDFYHKECSDEVQSVKEHFNEWKDTVEEFKDVVYHAGYDCYKEDIEKGFDDYVLYLYSLKEKKITNAYEITGKFVLSASGKLIAETNQASFYVVKVGEDWFISHNDDDREDLFDFVTSSENEKYAFLNVCVNHFLFYKLELFDIDR